MSVVETASCPDLGGQPRVDARHASGAAITICGYGGQLVSWRTADGVQQLYTSPQASFGPTTSIRGGAPICFPQFGAGFDWHAERPEDHPGPLPKHGFARTAMWRCIDHCTTPSATSVTMQLTRHGVDNCPQPWLESDFELSVTYAIDAKSLQISASLGPVSTALDFGFLLHTYLKVEDASTAQLRGLQGVAFRDATQSPSALATETRVAVTVARPTDSVYLSHCAGRLLELVDAGEDGSGRRRVIRNTSLPDCVVWNPGASGASDMADLPDDGWTKFVCVENGQVQTRRLEPGDIWSAGCTIEADLQPLEPRL